MATDAMFALVLQEIMDECSKPRDDGDVLIMSAVAASILREDRVRITGYAENIVQEYSEVEFRRIFRLSPSTFDVINSNLQEYEELQCHGNGGRAPVTVEKQLLITLFYLGSQDTILKIADRFGISESTVIDCRDRIMNVILTHLKSKFISWPDQNDIQHVKDFYERKNGFPGIVGCLDGTHIEISAPRENKKSYINRKGFHSIQLQCVCREDMRFTHCFTGFPGSCHDSRVLKNSDLWANGAQLCGDGHIIADGAYPLTPWLLKPYRDNGHLTPDQRNFNYHLSSNRVSIERSFGLLKGRFRRLQYLCTATVQTTLDIIMVCCIFHNMCIQNSDEVEEFMIQDMNIPRNIPRNVPLQAEGILKRDHIARNLPR